MRTFSQVEGVEIPRGVRRTPTERVRAPVVSDSLPARRSSHEGMEPFLKRLFLGPSSLIPLRMQRSLNDFRHVTSEVHAGSDNFYSILSLSWLVKMTLLDFPMHGSSDMLTFQDRGSDIEYERKNV